ncbi:hypothetical protein J1TS5_04090 [Paenibacillus macerans]|uniref:hypothetical protein n=1 Tax=Paenibacillus macerans TaxID=44252 RepID=UPI001AFF9C9C|nr:hypothetical protein [Paenibacillus macerans]GIP08239.1 hypothetical protein J1TS5_04090 [Paenibacillus macerans]
MVLLKNKKKGPHRFAPRGCMITLWNPAGSDPSPLLLKLLQLVNKREETAVVVEMPCLGIPRVAYRLGISDLEHAQTVDQLLIDYDRGMLQGIHDYLHHFDGFDGLLVQPKSKLDNPVLIKLQQDKTLQEIPAYLKIHLSGYHYIFVILQGQLIHPMTFFSLRESDHVVLSMNEPVEIIRSYTAYKTLRQDYALQNMYLFSETKNGDFKEETILSRPEQLIAAWEEAKHDNRSDQSGRVCAVPSA